MRVEDARPMLKFIALKQKVMHERFTGDFGFHMQDDRVRPIRLQTEAKALSIVGSAEIFPEVLQLIEIETPSKRRLGTANASSVGTLKGSTTYSPLKRNRIDDAAPGSKCYLPVGGYVSLPPTE